MIFRSAVVTAITAIFFCSLWGQKLRSPQFLSEARVGFDQMYRIEYEEAERTFQALRQRYPEHPAPPMYIAAATWLHELYRRSELQLDRFIAPGHFAEETNLQMSEPERKTFFDSIEESIRISEKILEENPTHLEARYFLGAAHGILASYAITIDHSKGEAFKQGKKAYKLHKEITEEDPEFSDAYMSVGLYEYIVDNLPWYIKWLATIVGYRGSEEKGFQYLQKAVAEGSFVSNDARVLQMVLFVREKRYEEALANARFLHQQYPENFILELNRAQILEYMDRPAEAAAVYLDVAHKAEVGQPNFQKLSLPEFRYQAGWKLMQLEQLQQAREQFEKAIIDEKTPERERALSHLRLGQILDLLGKRESAIGQYRKVLSLRDFEQSHKRAEEYLKKAYSG